MQPYQFGNQKGLGCANALTVLSSILIDVDKSGNSLNAQILVISQFEGHV